MCGGVEVGTDRPVVVGAGAGRRRAIGEGERHIRSARVGGARDGRL